jgi:hypothetical protein
LAVFCDASATTSTLTQYPFHDLLYIWEVVGASWGNYAYGQQRSKSVSYGPVAAFVFDTAGSYTIKLTVFDGLSSKTTTQAITVTAADTVFSTTNTIVVSTDGNFAGKPTGATEITSSDFDDVINTNIATGKRILFRGGQTFTSSAQADIDVAGPGIVGSFGTGKAIIQSGNNTIITGSDNATDWRVMNLEIDGQSNISAIGLHGSGSFSQFTYYGLDVRNVKLGWSLDANTLDLLNNVGVTTLSATANIGATQCQVTSAAGMVIGQGISITDNANNEQIGEITNISGNIITFTPATIVACNLGKAVSFYVRDVSGVSNPLWDQICIAECTIDNLIGADNSGANGMFLCASRLSVIGNSVNTQGGGEHAIRSMRIDRGVVQNNTTAEVIDSKSNITLRSLAYAGTATLAVGSKSNKVVCSDNLTNAGGSAGGCGPRNGQVDGRSENYIFERNQSSAVAATTDMWVLIGDYVTHRNNICDMSANTTVSGARSVKIESGNTGGMPDPSYNWIYNNSFYRAGAGGATYRCILVQVGCTNINAFNCAAYGPSTTGPVMVTNQTVGGVTSGDNWPDADIVTDLPYANATPSIPAQYAAAGAAIGGGDSALPVFIKFDLSRYGYGNTAPTLNIGAQ